MIHAVGIRDRSVVPTLRALWAGRWSVPWTIAVIGCGIGGRAIVAALTTLGQFDFVLVDPKRYTRQHVAAQQCSSKEVGVHKVEAVADLVRRRGSRATILPYDVTLLGDGVFGQSTFIITALDSLHAQLATNQLARRMRLPTMRLNTAPSINLASVRLYATHRRDGACVACGITEAVYRALDRSPPATAPSTHGCGPGTSALLADMAARAGRHMLQSLFAGAGDDYWNREYQVSLASTAVIASIMPRRATCPCCRLPPWKNLVFCSSNAAKGSLRQLIRSAVGARMHRARVGFCHALARGATCVSCGRTTRLLKWLPAYTSVVGSCSACGGPLLARDAALEAPARRLGSLLDLTIEQLGPPPGAIISVRAGNRANAFVFGAVRPCNLVLERTT